MGYAMRVQKTIDVHLEHKRPNLNAFGRSQPQTAGPRSGIPQTATAKLPTLSLPQIAEPQHARVYRLISEGKIEQAAQIAARMMNAKRDAPLLNRNNPVKLAEADAWLRSRLHAAENGEKADFEWVTPEVAQLLLQRNEGNRSVSSQYLAKIMRDLLADKFEVNGESIIVAVDGHLNDGQKRLWASLLCGRNIRSNMSWGVARSTQKTVDSGQIRSKAGALEIDGVTSGKHKAAIVSLAFELKFGRQPSHQEANDYYHENAEDIEASFSVVGAQRRGASKSALSTAALFWIERGMSEKTLRPFFQMLQSGLNAPRTITVLRDEILSKGVKKSITSRKNWAFTTAHHIMAWRKNKAIGIVKEYDAFPDFK